MNSNSTDRLLDARGFTLLQLVITLAIMGVVGTFAIVNLASSQDWIRLQNSVRQLGGYLEKARLDAVRRHSTANVTFTTPTTYNVTLDFNGTGTPITRTFTLENGVSIISTPLPNLNFNWRGRTSACTNTFALQNFRGNQSWVDVSDAGDVTINSDVNVLPSVSYATASTTSDVAPSMVVTGAAAHNNTADCPAGSGGAAGPPITGSGSGGCTVGANPSSLSIKKNGAGTGTITISPNSTGLVTVSGPINLAISPTSKNITAGGSASFSVTSTNTTRGTFAVNFSSPCTTVTVLVSVTN